MPFVDFMQSPFGRTLRVALGLVLILLGLFGVGGALGIVLAVVGLVPLVAGVTGICIAAPLFGADFHGFIRTR
jgi:hypothetical protein